MSAVCTFEGCGRPIDTRRRRKTTFCRQCVGKALARDPEITARRRAKLTARWTDPVYRERARASISKARQLLMQDPVKRARAVEHGRWLASLNQGNVCRPAGSATRRQAARKASETKLAWCPPEYRADYLHLLYKKNIPAAEARAMIEQLVAADRERWLRTGRLPQAGRTEARS